MPTLNVRTDAETLARWKQGAKDRGVPVAELVRQGLGLILDGELPPKAPVASRRVSEAPAGASNPAAANGQSRVAALAASIPGVRVAADASGMPLVDEEAVMLRECRPEGLEWVEPKPVRKRTKDIEPGTYVCRRHPSVVQTSRRCWCGASL